jgi:hypothetical protein
MIYAVNYDLKKPGRDYSGLHEAIKSCGVWWHYLGSTWLVDTTLDAAGIFASLKPHIDTNDYMLVIRVAGDKQGWLPKEAWNWINQRQLAFA